MKGIEELANQTLMELNAEEERYRRKLDETYKLALASKHLPAPKRRTLFWYSCPSCGKGIIKDEFSQTFDKMSWQYKEWASEVLSALLSTAYVLMKVWRCLCGYAYATIFYQDWGSID